MPRFTYQIETNLGSASGSIKAADEDQAKSLLTKQYTFVDKHSSNVDDNGKKITPEVLSCTLSEYQESGAE